MLDAATIEARAAALFDGRARHQRFEPFVGDSALPSIESAYAVQAVLVRRLLARHQTRVAGYKIGLTSPRMQAMCGIDSPIAGVVFANRVHASGASLARAAYGRLGIEFEIGVELGCDLPAAGAPYDFARVSAAVGAVTAAVEVVDDRGADYHALDMRSLVADNSWNAGIVLGAWQRRWPDLATLGASVRCDGVEIDRGQGGDVLGHPFHALTWLANHLAQSGQGLARGDIVATGSIVTTRFPERPAQYQFTLDGLCEVSLAVV